MHLRGMGRTKKNIAGALEDSDALGASRPSMPKIFGTLGRDHQRADLGLANEV